MEAEIDVRAKRLMGQVMKTWDPPRFTGAERPEDIAQTATMITIAYLMGREFMPSALTDNQRAAIDSGLEMFNYHLKRRQIID
jgi:hypothetical protein